MSTIETSATDADRLMREAHEQAYRYPEGFGGFRAGLLYDGGRGTVTLSPGQAPEVEIDSAEPEDAWLGHELGMLAGHRWHRPYEEADGRWDKTVDDTPHPLGALIAIADRMDSSYRVRDGEITLITRTHGGMRFSIAIQERIAAPDGRTISSAFTAAYWDTSSGRLVRSEAYTDSFVSLGAALLPAVRRVVTADDDGVHVRQLELIDHELLSPSEGSL